MELILPLQFFIYAFLGWLCECIYCSFPKRKWINRGMLQGPYCPIYGFGAIFVAGLLRPYDSKPWLVFVLGVVITSVLEYVTSYILERLFHTKWWDYEGKFLNINGRVCFRNSFLFGMLSLFVVYVLDPFLLEWLHSFSTIGQGLFLVCISIIFGFDVYKTVRTLLKDNREWQELEMIISHYFSDNNYESKGRLKEELQHFLEKMPFEIHMFELFSEIRRRYDEFVDKNNRIRNHLRQAYPNAKFGRKNIPSIIKLIIHDFKNDNSIKDHNTKNDDED